MKKLFRFFILAAFIFPLLHVALQSQDEELQKIKNTLPKMLGANNAGNDFWLTVPPCYEDESSSYDNFIKLYVASDFNTPVTVEVPGKNYKVTKMTQANDVIEFNLTLDVATPWRKTGHEQSPAETVWEGNGIHVYSDNFIVVYCVVRYRMTSDGFLAAPVHCLGKDYQVASYGSGDAITQHVLPSLTGCVSVYDNTTVDFTLGGNNYTKTAGDMFPGYHKKWTLNKGDVIMVASEGADADMTGSRWLANKPIGVVSGNYCANIPVDNRWCDYVAEMDMPTYQWANDYHVGKIPDRKYPSLIRIFAKEPNTQIYRDGQLIGLIQEAGGKQNKGWIEVRAVPIAETPRSVVISGDKPINVVLCNTGVQEDGNPLPDSDPFLMAMTPVNQYQKEIIFCTPGVYGGVGFRKNFVNLVYETGPNGEMPDDVEFAQVIDGNYYWEKLKYKFSGEDEKFAYDVNGKKYALKTITLPKLGVYKIRAEKPFAAYSFGYDYCDSYGYPTSTASTVIGSNDDMPPAIIVRTDDSRGAYVRGTTVDMPEDEADRTNMSLVLFHSDAGYNYEFTKEEFIPGQDRELNWELNVIDNSKNALGFLTFVDRNGNDTTVYYAYSGQRVGLEDGQDVPEGFASRAFSVGSSAAVVDFTLRQPGQTDVYLYDESGRLVKKVLSEDMAAGKHSVSVDCNGLSSGTYIIVLISGDYKDSALLKIVK